MVVSLMSKLHAIKDKLIEVILDQHSFTKNSDTPSLESLKTGVLNTELTRLIDEATKNNEADHPLLNSLLPVIVLLNSFTHSNAFLDEAQQAHVKEVLIELFTTLSTLCVTGQTSVYTSKSGMTYHGFLNSNATYSQVGETISGKLKDVWDLEQTNAEIDAIEADADQLIPSKVDLLVQSYQDKVEPDHLRAENKRLQAELAEQGDLIAELRRQISAMQTKLAAPAAEKRAPNPALGKVYAPLFMQQHYPPTNVPGVVVHHDKTTQTLPIEELSSEGQSCIHQ